MSSKAKVDPSADAPPVSTVLSQVLIAFTIEPYPDGWRARKPYVSRTLAFIDDPAASLPHFPMVLHRGGYPDGT